MKEEIADLITDVGSSIEEAYRRGLEKGGLKNKAILDSKKDMLSKFDSYINKNYKRIEDAEFVLFIDKNDKWEIAHYKEKIIKTFLLSYDDE